MKDRGTRPKMYSVALVDIVKDLSQKGTIEVNNMMNACKRVNQKDITVFVADNLIVWCDRFEFDATIGLYKRQSGEIEFDQLHHNSRQNKEYHQVWYFWIIS